MKPAVTMLLLGVLALSREPLRPRLSGALQHGAGSKEGASGERILTELDGDGNGLYDDTERKAMLDAMLKACPELKQVLDASAAATFLTPKDAKGIDFSKPASVTAAADAPRRKVFDANGDGKVTIEEQSEGTHPLSMLVPKSFLGANIRIPWAIDIFPEWISAAYLQEDVALGAVAEHRPRGTLASWIPASEMHATAQPSPGSQLAAAQSEEELQPVKSEAKGGVEFPANSGRFLSMPGQRDARWNYRWCLFTFRVDGNSGADSETVLLDLNRGHTSNKSSPKIWYSKQTGLNIQYVGLNKGGLDKRVMATRNVVADGRSWNVLVCGIRYGQMYASVNGLSLSTETRQPPRFSGDWPLDTTSYLGSEGKGGMAWAYDSLVFGLTEPSEAMVRKMTGWAAHRLGFQDRLPEGHPYRVDRPVLDGEDFPYRYVHNDKKWVEWGRATKDKARKLVNAGGPRVEPRGFERVFYDDFRADRIRNSGSGEGDLWMGPGWNIAVGIDAPLATPGKQPDAYPYDAAGQKQTLALIQRGDRRWAGSAFYSVNDLGHGYTWAGPKIFRIRCMFPKVPQEELAKGLFPAFWSYNPDALFWRTANRIEVDWWEFDGKNGRYLNGLSTHLHYPTLKTIFPKNPGSYSRWKVYGGELTEAGGRIPGGLYFWDGEFHTWEFVVGADTTYINVTIKDSTGRERWVEVCRSPTAPTYLERLDLQLDYALKAKEGVPADGTRQDFVVDEVEVLQMTRAIEAVAEPFTGRPSLSGSVTAGGAVTCQPNLKDIQDVRYYWFADGYPLTYGPDCTYVVTPAEAGKAIRCMVKAVGARNMPEAWSNVLK